MPKIAKTLQNPHGLSAKQKLVIDDMVSDVKQGKKLDAVKSTNMIYNAKNKHTNDVIASKNMNSVDFRTALIEKLASENIIGANGKVSRKIMEGLDAVNETKDGIFIDYKTRLQYIQEINKITGVYAPEKTEQKTLKINVNMSSEELQDKIKELTQELATD